MITVRFLLILAFCGFCVWACTGCERENAQSVAPVGKIYAFGGNRISEFDLPHATCFVLNWYQTEAISISCIPKQQAKESLK